MPGRDDDDVEKEVADVERRLSGKLFVYVTFQPIVAVLVIPLYNSHQKNGRATVMKKTP